MQNIKICSESKELFQLRNWEIKYIEYLKLGHVFHITP